MEISIALPHTEKFASPETTAYAAEEAERRGCSAVWVLERLLRPTNPRPSPERPSPAMPESYANVYDPLETLAYVAAKTGRISLRDLGAEVTDILIPGIETVHGIAMPILLTEASYHHKRWYPERADDYTDGTRSNLAEGFKVSGVDYVEALQERRRFTQTVDQIFDDVDVLVCPTAPFTATETDPDFEGGAIDYILRTVPFDVTGHPALTVPAGNTESQNLPAGMELIAGRRREDTLYRVAAAYEEHMGGFARPPLCTRSNTERKARPERPL